MVATRISNRWVLAVLALACLAFPTVVAHFHENKIFNDDIFWGAGTRMAGAFTGGIVLARLHRLAPERERAVQGGLATAALVALGICLLLPPLGYSLLTPCFGLLVYGLAADRGAASRLFAQPLAVWLGLISFPLYLLHVMALSWLRFTLDEDHAGGTERLAATALLCVFVFALAWLLHLYVEQPSHRFARRAIAPEGEAAPVAVS